MQDEQNRVHCLAAQGTHSFVLWENRLSIVIITYDLSTVTLTIFAKTHDVSPITLTIVSMTFDLSTFIFPIVIIQSD